MTYHEGRWYSDGGYILYDCEVTDGSGRVISRYRDPLKNVDHRAIEMADHIWDSLRAAQQETWAATQRKAPSQRFYAQQQERTHLQQLKRVKALMDQLDAQDRKVRQRRLEFQLPVKADWKTADELGVESVITPTGYVLQTKDGKLVTLPTPDPQALGQWLQPVDLAYFRDHHYTGSLADLAGVAPPKPSLMSADSENSYVHKTKIKCPSFLTGRRVRLYRASIAVYTALALIWAAWIVFMILSVTVGKPQTHHKAPSTTQQHEQGPQGAPGPAGQGKQLKSTKVVSGHVIITYTDGTTSDAGLVKGH